MRGEVKLAVIRISVDKLLADVKAANPYDNERDRAYPTAYDEGAEDMAMALKGRWWGMQTRRKYERIRCPQCGKKQWAKTRYLSHECACGWIITESDWMPVKKRGA